MKISPLTIYAIQALQQIAKTDRPTLDDIARSLDISLAYAKKVAWALRQAGVIQGVRGPKGGYVLAVPLDQIEVSQVVQATEGLVESSRTDTREMAAVRKALRSMVAAGFSRTVADL